MTKLERLQNIGIRRLGTPKRGFRYKPQSGRLTKTDLDRINDLKIPPAWTDVFINPAANGRVQAIGKDAAGRWQYLYHESHTRAQGRWQSLFASGRGHLHGDGELFVKAFLVESLEPHREQGPHQRHDPRWLPRARMPGFAAHGIVELEARDEVRFVAVVRCLPIVFALTDDPIRQISGRVFREHADVRNVRPVPRLAHEQATVANVNAKREQLVA